MADTETTTTTTTVAKEEEEEEKDGIPEAAVWLEKGKCSGNKDYLWWCVNQIEQGKLDEIYEDDNVTLKYPDDVQQQLVSHMIRGIHQCVEWQNEDELEEEEREPAADKLYKYVTRWAQQKQTWDEEYKKKEELRRKRLEEIRSVKVKTDAEFAKKEEATRRKVAELVRQKKEREAKEAKEAKEKAEKEKEEGKSQTKEDGKAKEDDGAKEDDVGVGEEKRSKYVVFPSKDSPEKIPDLKTHYNYMSEVLAGDPKIYDELRNAKTSKNVTLARCIKTGVENPARFFVKPAGLVAGDIHCFSTFKKLFDPVLELCHKDYNPQSEQKHNFDLEKLDQEPLDPSGKYVASVRLSTGRSIEGYCLPPAISFTDRRAIETAIMNALEGLKGEIKGTYYPLQYQKKLKKTSEKKFKENKEQIEKTKKKLKKSEEDLKKLKDDKKDEKKDEEEKKKKEVDDLKEELKKLQKAITDDDYSLLDGSRSCPDKLFGISKEKEDKLRASIVLVIDAKKAYLEYIEAKEKAKKAEENQPEQKNDGKETAAQAAARKANKKKEKAERASDAKSIAAAAAVADAAVAEIERDEAEAIAEAFQFPSYSKEIGEWNEARPKLLRRIRMIEQLDFEIADKDKEIAGEEKKIEAKRKAQIDFVRKLTKQLTEDKVEFKNTRFLSSGCERHWPDARGVFHNEDHSVFVRVNEQDHMRVVSICDQDEKKKENKQDIQGAFKRLVGVLNGVSDYLGKTVDRKGEKKQSLQYMGDDHLGYVVTCPSSLGTGLCASALVKIPKLSQEEDFDQRLEHLGLQKRIHIMGLQDCKSNQGNEGKPDIEGKADDQEKELCKGYWNLSNAQCYGETEVDLMNRVIEGIRQCIQWEIKKENGEDLEPLE